MAVVGFEQVAIGVADLERSVRFYRDLLGFREVGGYSFSADAACRSLGIEMTSMRSALLVCDGLRLELLALDSRDAGVPAATANPETRTTRGLAPAHLCLRVDDLTSTLQSLRDRGCPVLEATFVDHGAGTSTCLVRYPDGGLVLLLQRPIGAGSPWDEAGA